MPTIQELHEIKAASDKRDYEQKTRKLRELIIDKPNEWFVDSEEGNFLGITHKPTGYRYHLPRQAVPSLIAPQVPQAPQANQVVKVAEDLVDFAPAPPVLPQNPMKDTSIGLPIAAVKNSSILQVDPNEVEYEAHDPAHMWAESTHLAPLLGNMKGARAFIASKYISSQALPLKNAESAYVDTLDRETGESYNKTVGKKIGMVYANKSGTVYSVGNNAIQIAGEKGKLHENELHYYYPSNRKTSRTDTPLVKVGDVVQEGQPIAHSNYVTSDGTMAMGKNLRVAFVPGPRGSTFEDSIAVSQSAADNLTSQHTYGYDLEHKFGVQSKKNKYISLFPNKYTNEQLAKIGSDGNAMEGAVLNPGDPIVLGFHPRELSTQDKAIGNLHKTMRNSYADVTQEWKKPTFGIVSDSAKTRSGISVNISTDMPLRVGDKISARSGSKGVVGAIIPDSKMFHDVDGKPVDILINPQSIIGRVNPTNIYEALLGKVSHQTGKRYLLPSFSKENTIDMVSAELEKYKIKSNEDLFDPETKRRIPNVLTGHQYFLKLEHTSESKISGRGEGSSDLNEQPAKGGDEGSKRLGGLMNNALLSHGAINVLKDAKLNRGSKNAEMWTRIKNGDSLPAPKVPFIYNKFIDTLKAGGINSERKGDKMHFFAMTDQDTDELAKYSVTNAETVDPKTGDPIKGGLFDHSLHGVAGKEWSKIDLDIPMPNPLMEDPIRSFLGITKVKYRDVIAGKDFINGKTGAEAIRQEVGKLDFAKIERDARDEIKTGRGSKRNEAVKRLNYSVGFKRMELEPDDLFMSKVPVIPPTYRPVSNMGKMMLVSDANYLYKDLMTAQQALRVNKDDLPDSELAEEKLAVYDSIRAIQGLGDPINKDLAEKGVKGFIKTISGTGGPKSGLFLSKVVGHGVNSVGRSVVIPNADLNMDEVGVPEKMAWRMFSPFTMGRMVRDGMPAGEAARQIENQSPLAKSYLVKEMEDRPVMYSRDPALHRFAIMGAYAKLVPGSSIQTSPLVNKPFTLDHDGDAMGVHVPVSQEAVDEIKKILLPSKNLLSIKSREVHYQPSQEFISGIFNSTTVNKKKSLYTFNTRDEAKKAYDRHEIDIDSPVKILDEES